MGWISLLAQLRDFLAGPRFAEAVDRNRRAFERLDATVREVTRR